MVSNSRVSREALHRQFHRKTLSKALSGGEKTMKRQKGPDKAST